MGAALLLLSLYVTLLFYFLLRSTPPMFSFT